MSRLQPLIALAFLVTSSIQAAEPPNKTPWSLEQQRLIAEINRMESDISIYQAGGTVSALVAGTGYLSWQLSNSQAAQNVGLGLAVGGYLAHEGLLYFGANSLSDQLIARRYILAANGAGHPALKANPAVKDVGILSGTTRAYRTEYFFDGMFWSTAFVAQSIVAGVKYLPSDEYKDSDKALHTALAGVFAMVATYKFLHYFMWKSEMHSELSRLNTTASVTPDVVPTGDRGRFLHGARFQIQSGVRF